MLRMPAPIERYYNINKFFLSKMGLWPSQSIFLRILLPTIALCTVASIGMLELVRLLETWRDTSEVYECFIIIIVSLGANVKLLTVVLNKHDMQRLLSLIEYHWRLFTHSEEMEILRDYATVSKKITLFYAVGVYTLMSLYLLLPVIPRILDLVKPLNNSRPYNFMFNIHFGFDRNDHYYLVLFHSYLASFFAISAMVSVDTLYMAYAQHGCSLFAAVGNRLENITSRLKDNDYYSQGDDPALLDNACPHEDNEVYRELVQCLYKHQVCIEYVNLLDTSFAVYTIVLLFMNVMATSLLGVEVIVLWDRKDEMMRYMSMSIGGFIHLLALNYPGERILNHSSDIFHKAYNAKWYRLSRKTTQLLSIFLYRSIVPCTLTAGKVVILSMANYASVVQMSMSYFTTLSSFR